VDRHQDLGDFLRTRRAAVDPIDVGLPAGGRRRAPGLRREEVALLAGVSVTWYTWLEQGRPVNPSRSVLDAVARTLLLDDAEHAHLLVLADEGGGPSAPSDDGDGLPPDALVRAVEALDPSPAYLLGPRWEYLAWNVAQGRLYPSAAELDDEDRNLLLIVLGDAAARALIVDWEDEARNMVTEFRAATAGRRRDGRLDELVARLRRTSPEFDRWWSDHDVAGFHSRLRRYRHPTAGLLTFEYQAFVPAEWPAYRLVSQLPVPGDDSTARLAASRP
jgi:transcriptional regulator with XRE-family HTH domain